MFSGGNWLSPRTPEKGTVAVDLARWNFQTRAALPGRAPASIA